MFTWTIDPVLFHLPDFLGGRGIRYYGVLYAIALMGAFYWLQWQMTRGGHKKEVADRFLTFGVVAVIVGARLGHCLFYGTKSNRWYYYENPIEILYFWEGGLASHGTAVAIILWMYIFARREKMPFREVVDRLSFGVAWSAACVRLGNFMNSEIVGRASDASVGVKFPRHYGDRGLLKNCAEMCERVSSDVCVYLGDRCMDVTAVPWRHASQLYEVAMGLGMLAILWITDRAFGGEKRPLGLLGSMFLAFYFTGRFFVEYFKEYQTLDGGFTMGQWLSIPLVTVGVIGMIVALRKRETPPRPAAD
ncbi:MAG: phosphatidylglycerol:prolipoprotein diacylglycerol transferase [Bradymonadia bacterium]